MVTVRLYRLTIVFALFSYTGIPAQKIDSNVQPEIRQLKALFNDADIVALRENSVFSFEYDKKNSTLVARQQDAHEYIAMKPNAEFIIRNYYNDKSQIESYSLTTGNGKSLHHNKYCGHYQQGSVFYSDAQVCAYQFKLDLQGKTASFQTRIVYSDIKYLTHTFFHSEAPSKRREIVINVPAWVNIELREMNFDGYDIRKTVKQENGSTVYTYVAENLEALPDENNLPGYLHFLPHILILTKSYQQNGQQTTVLSTTGDLYKWYSSLTSTIRQNHEPLKPLVHKLVSGLTSDEDKIKAIYYWVQDNIKYIAFEDGLAAFKPEDAHEVFYKKYGDCKGMANLTKEMLKLAGFDARLTWIGTDRIPYSSEIPSLAVNNHMICTVFAGDVRYVLDPTEKFNPLGLHAERIQGKDILVEDGDSYIVATIPEEPLENYLQEWSWKYEIKDQTLKGSGTAAIRGEYKKILLNVIESVKAEDRDKFLKTVVAGNDNPDNIVIRDRSVFERDKILSIGYDMNLKNNLSSYDNEVYLDMDFSDDFKGASLDKDRKVPYKFMSKALKKINAELTIPSGYKIEHLPEPFKFSNEHFAFDLNYRTEGNTIFYSKEIRILKSILPVSEFDNWNSAVEKLTKFYNDQIILKSNEQ